MSREDGSEPEVSHAFSHIRTYVFIVIGSLLLIFAMFWIALRLNYRLYLLRNSFRSTIVWITTIIIVLLIIFFATLTILNLIAKQQEYKKNHIDVAKK